MKKPKEADANAAEQRAYSKALEEFAKAFVAGVGGNDDAAVGRLGNTQHEHTSLLLFGDSPVWRKKGIIVKVTIEFGQVLPPEQLQAFIDAGKAKPAG